MLKGAKDTQKIYSWGPSNDTMASDFSKPQFHAINVFSNSIMYGVLELSLRVIIYYILLCIRVCAYFINKPWILFEDDVEVV